MKRGVVLLLIAGCGGQETTKPAPVLVPSQPAPRATASASATATASASASTSTSTSTSKTPVITVLSSSDPACALDENGRVWRWHGDEMERDVESIGGAKAIGCAGRHACVIASDGSAWCWGNRSYGALGDGKDGIKREDLIANVPQRVLDITNVVDIGLDFDRTCARTTNGDVFCWGDSEFGKAGDGRTPDNVGREKVRPGKAILTGATTLSVGSTHAVSVMNDGRVSCWGQNNSSTCGFPLTKRYVARPEFVPKLKDVVVARAAGGTTCVVDKDGKVWCWGQVAEILGPARPKANNVQTTDKPVIIPIAERIADVAVGGNGFACARDVAGGVHCWGQNDHGQLGDGTKTTRDVAAPVKGITNAKTIAAGLADVCALVEGGRVMCWGEEHLRKKGHSRFDDATTPVALTLHAGG